eukprot:TRINITY_DN24021_c0_g1_i1.p1 TRINITY_DN24021_c0_g1~~TRINITY_DN24021_c0_g1_i1.p1  ORF type:complete len:247 (-),score=61.09 TRINITY_DN24021_c0_g1_i1:47-748(-)
MSYFVGNQAVEGGHAEDTGFAINGVDFRTDEEIADDEHEARRIERFFDVDRLPETECMIEWSAKEEALSEVVAKLLKSSRFTEALTRGVEALLEAEEASSSSSASDDLSAASASATHGSSAVGDLAAAVEVSYVLPPAPPADSHDATPTVLVDAAVGVRPTWAPRLVITHQNGALVLVTLEFERVEKAKDREARWTCTALRSDLVATVGGEPTAEPIGELRGPLPHGVRYMRL